MPRIDEFRLMANVARMVYTVGLRQAEICERLNIHQSTVSRLLKRAERVAQLRAVRRVIGVAGGRRKVSAIRGALAGKLLKVLITDLATAVQLLAESVAKVAVTNRRAAPKRTGGLR